MRAHGLNLPDPPASSRVHQCRRAACLERFPSRDARPPYCDGAIVVRQSGGRDAEWRRRAQSGRLRPDPASTASSVRFADRPVLRSGKSGEVSLPRRVPSPRSGCLNYHWRFVPRGGCRDESATTRRASVREANRKPISGAQRPQPATRHLVRQRLLRRRLHTRENCSRISHLSDALSFVCVRAPGREPVVPVAWPAD